MISLTTMSIQLINNEPDGIRICRIEGKSLVTIVVPRDQLAEAARLPQLPQRGIYYLLDESRGILNRVYAGQTIQGISRLESHRTKKDFWNKAVMFLDEDWNIDRDVLDALEAKAISYIQKHGSYETDNKMIPSPRLSPYKEQRVKELHDDILFRMEVLGLDLNRFEPNESTRHASFHTRKNGVHAQGRYNVQDGSFTVLAGSEIDLDKSVIKNRVATESRSRLFGASSGSKILNEDISFSSPSSAATFVLGGSQNGWVEWVDSRGQTLDSVYRHQS